MSRSKFLAIAAKLPAFKEAVLAFPTPVVVPEAVSLLEDEGTLGFNKEAFWIQNFRILNIGILNIGILMFRILKFRI